MEFQAKKKKNSYSNGFDQHFVTNIPHQPNADDCGVYTCLFAELCAKDGNQHLLVRTDFELNMPRYRKKILKSILI